MSATHLITGVGGQDGVLLARHLLARGDRVIGTSRSGGSGRLSCYLNGVELVRHDVRDAAGFRSLLTLHRPGTVFNLAALSSVGASWDDPETTREVNQTAVEDMLAVLADGGDDRPRFVHASSSEIFGPPGPEGGLTDETSALNPVSPYAEAKAAAHLAVARARADGLGASNMILFGHTSTLQAAGFVLPSIALQTAEVGIGQRSQLVLRNPAIRRDWGSANDVARAFAATLGAEADDYVIATGDLHGLSEIAEWALGVVGRAACRATASGDGDGDRPHDFDGRFGQSARARTGLGWEPRTTLRHEIERMVAVSLSRLQSGVQEDPAYLAEATGNL